MYPQGLKDSKVHYVFMWNMYSYLCVDHEKNAVFIHRILWYMKMKAAACINCDIHIYNCYRQKHTYINRVELHVKVQHTGYFNAISMYRRY